MLNLGKTCLGLWNFELQKSFFYLFISFSLSLTIYLSLICESMRMMIKITTFFFLLYSLSHTHFLSLPIYLYFFLFLSISLFTIIFKENNLIYLNPFHINPLAVVCGTGGWADSAPPPNISAPDGARRLFFWYNVHQSKIYQQKKEF